MKIANIAAIAAIALMASGCDVLEEDNSSSYSPIYEKMGSQEVAEFGTVQYTVGKIVKTSDMPQTFWDKFKIGDRKALIRCTATLKAGIDISSGNYKVEVDGKKVLLQLPHAKIFEPINMDFDNVHLEYSKVGLLRSSFSLAEYVAYLQEGEKQILADQNLISQIIKQAESNAEPMFRSMLKNLGFEAIKIEFVL
ncbi:MAG: DUF4230 domain-containing protein [Bacteroidales bacterium]|jgi:hypothetical protein|nr:DUF4230 domain-containing protein [Bacteroidales bacterium]MBR3712686.1 DUF4230 domain-containing protein [Bacteroidales bacterium]MBR4273272.1 DUF4230 domain-containing protein [Bacteroidales bacterium]